MNKKWIEVLMKFVSFFAKCQIIKTASCFLCVAILLFFPIDEFAQPKVKDKLYQGLILDEVMVKAVQTGFDVKAFIQKVKNDTTYYKAFKTLRIVSFDLYSDIIIEDKQQNQKASYQGVSHQKIENHCRSMHVKHEKVSGDFYKRNKQYRYNTAKLYAHLFFTQGSICNETNLVGNKVYSGTAKYEEQLRMLIFNPGKRISGIPGIGDNVAIFEEPYFSRYNFYLSRTTYLQQDCYVFTAKPKAAFKKQVVINELRTWFRVSDFAIMARDYSLSFKTLFYDFDVVMKVKLKPFKQHLVPYEVYYKGNWHVFSKSREMANFTAIFSDFQ
ncbi:MAG: hypothetical protein IPI46_09345 [Bacteroidetes bacterium]|nr:hypothetical protein [Bacteroidota bacterium]